MAFWGGGRSGKRGRRVVRGLLLVLVIHIKVDKQEKFVLCWENEKYIHVKNSGIQLGFKSKTWIAFITESLGSMVEDQKTSYISSIAKKNGNTQTGIWTIYKLPILQTPDKSKMVIIYDSWNTEWKQHKRTLFDSAMCNGLHFPERKMFRCSAGSWFWVQSDTPTTEPCTMWQSMNHYVSYTLSKMFTQTIQKPVDNPLSWFC